jgi:hypothetical protein
MPTLHALRRSPARAPAWRLAPLVLLLACAPKTRPAALTPAVPTLYAGLLQPQAPGAPAGPIPRAVQDEATRLLVVRGLTPTVLPDTALREGLGPARTHPQRLAYLAAQPGGAGMLVMMETEAVFYAQIEGRNRWTVRVRLTITPQDDLRQALVEEFDVPVFLQFLHEKEERAVEEAGPLIARRLAAALDEVVAARAAAPR